ncbi:hypothetical protein AGMMS50256_37950 [Betaproteobacteria bacterium]|nr:hypothetical protein AGMMS50256_37950 [Betaproteobacteria bacterium]
MQKEHLEPFTGWKRDGAGRALNLTSGFLDVEKYNNYLFDKAATTLVDQARQMGLALDKKETIAQLKADNAEIAAIKYSATERIKYQNMCQDVVFSYLTVSDVDSLTDMYIKAKENGLDTTQVIAVASHLGNHNSWRESGIIFLENDFDASYFDRIQNKTDMAGIIKAKLADTTFGFKYEKEFFEQLLNPRLHLGGVNDKTLNFLLQMLDIYSPDSEPTESWK